MFMINIIKPGGQLNKQVLYSNRCLPIIYDTSILGISILLHTIVLRNKIIQGQNIAISPLITQVQAINSNMSQVKVQVNIYNHDNS